MNVYTRVFLKLLASGLVGGITTSILSPDSSFVFLVGVLGYLAADAVDWIEHVLNVYYRGESRDASS